MMMTDDDRKKVFWLLKKYSSYTAWKAMGDAFQAFTDAFEHALKNAKPPLDADSLWFDAIKDFWKGCEGFDKGLPLLKQGDRYIFRSKNNWLIFEQLDYADSLMNERDYVHSWMVNEQEVKQLYARLDDLSNGPGWTTERVDGNSAAITNENVFRSPRYPFKVDYARFNFPIQLPEVPDPTTTTVDTGKEVPLDGIWEPEWPGPDVKQNRVVGIRSLFTPAIPTNVQKGCMNYLVAGTIAPPYQDGARQPVMPVRWRLIWQDTRYMDGTIPDEEAEYVALAQTSHSAHVDSGVLRAKAGESCLRTGIWQSQDANAEKRFYKEGEIIGDLVSAYGLTIWQYVDKN